MKKDSNENEMDKDSYENEIEKGKNENEIENMRMRFGRQKWEWDG